MQIIVFGRVSWWGVANIRGWVGKVKAIAAVLILHQQQLQQLGPRQQQQGWQREEETGNQQLLTLI